MQGDRDGSRVAIRWTIGDVSARGFAALALSIHGARQIFGPRAAYAVCVNSLPVGVAQRLVGEVAHLVEWHASDGQIPAFLRSRIAPDMAEGVAWKFAPLRLVPDRFELALDNDCILWEMPTAIRHWLDMVPEKAPCVLAGDMAAHFGWFAPFCPPAPRNSGIRGLPPGFDLGKALQAMLDAAPGIMLAGEVDEQGLQVAALSRQRPPLVVSTEEVTICSPLDGHTAELGSCGAHFVGLNMRHPRPEHGCTQAMLDAIAANFDARRVSIATRLGVGGRSRQISESTLR